MHLRLIKDVVCYRTNPLYFHVAEPVVFYLQVMESNPEETNKTPVTEYDVKLFIDNYGASSKKSEVLYNKATALNRLCFFLI